MIFAVDICNTIADVNTQIAKIIGKWPSHMYKHPAITKEFFENHPEVFIKAMPYPGAAETLKLIKSDIIYLSSRPDWAWDITKDWLQKNDFPEGLLILTHNKVLMAKKIGVIIAIEDNPEDIILYQKEGINVLVKAQPYNIDYGPRFDWKTKGKIGGVKNGKN